MTPDQALFRDASARFMDSVCPMPQVRALSTEAAGVDPAYLRQAAELGWFGLFVPEGYGGGSVSEVPLLDAVVLAGERGRRLQPGPVIPTGVVSLALATAGSDEQRETILPELASGKALATWAVTGPAGDHEPSAGVTAVRRPGGYRLSGSKCMVQDGHIADWLLITAGADDGHAHFIVPTGEPGVAVTLLDGLDITRRFSEVQLDDVWVQATARVGPPAVGAELTERLLDTAALLTAAESAGALDRLFSMTVDYAKDRVAFGRPIGSFQAVKHQLADLSLLVECSHAIIRSAADAVGQQREDASSMASIAKAFVSDCCIDVPQGCLQVHGGIGYTWEHDLHLYLRRLATDCALFGDASWHRERVCRLNDV